VYDWLEIAAPQYMTVGRLDHLLYMVTFYFDEDKMLSHSMELCKELQFCWCVLRLTTVLKC